MWNVDYGSYLAPLFNGANANQRRRLDALDIHFYPYRVDGLNDTLQGNYNWWSQALTVKITRDVPLILTEMNYRIPDASVSQDQAGINGFSHYWNVLAFRNQHGRFATQHLGFWDPLILQPVAPNWSGGYETGLWMLGMAKQLNPWKGNERGRAIRLLAQLTKGMRFTAVDDVRGVYTLEGSSGSFARKMYVWHNRPNWTNTPGARFKVQKLPARASRVDVYAYNCMDDNGNVLVYKSLDVGPNQASVTFDNLAQGQTLVFAIH